MFECFLAMRVKIQVLSRHVQLWERSHIGLETSFPTWSADVSTSVHMHRKLISKYFSLNINLDRFKV